MNHAGNDKRAGMEFLNRMFEVEMRFLSSAQADVEALVAAFHRDVVVHEPESLPYAGDWRGLEGIGALFRSIREVWSDMRVDDLEGVRVGDIIFMTCKLQLTCRANGAVICQPFAEVLRLQDDRLIDGTPFYYDTAELLAAIRHG